MTDIAPLVCADCQSTIDEPPDDEWQPDHQLITAIIADAGRPLRSLGSRISKCWAVSGLREEGLTVDQITDLLKPCSRRTICTLLADPMTLAFRLFFREAATFSEELRLSAHELRTVTLAFDSLTAEADRVRAQRDQLIDMAMTGEPVKMCRHQHLMDRYNTYEDPKTGKRACRRCRANAVRRSRGLPEIDIAELYQDSAATPAPALHRPAGLGTGQTAAVSSACALALDRSGGAVRLAPGTPDASGGRSD